MKSIIISLICALLLYSVYDRRASFDIKESVLRLHIVADSNSEYDQSLKLKVRDAILEKFYDDFSLCESVSEAQNLLEEKLPSVIAVAKECVGEEYSIGARVGETYFPKKSYGEISLPKGRYEALQLEIGSGSGENWWCVLYPPLCITKDAVSLPKSSLDKLKKTLSDEDFKKITGKKAKFKIIEVLKRCFDGKND